MELLESNLPLKFMVPISRQQVPSGSSACPVKLTRSLLRRVQTAGCGVFTGLSSTSVSSSKNEPTFPARAMSIRFLFQPVMVNLTRQHPGKINDGFLSLDRGNTGLDAVAVCPTTRSKSEITKTRIFVFLVKV